MTTQQIKEQLCLYDKRNPDYEEDNERINKHKECYCDNCFTGRNDLADELLRQKEINKEQLTAIENTRIWYVTKGFKALQDDTPIIFSKLFSICLEYSEGNKDKFI